MNMNLCIFIFVCNVCSLTSCNHMISHHFDNSSRFENADDVCGLNIGALQPNVCANVELLVSYPTIPKRFLYDERGELYYSVLRLCLSNLLRKDRGGSWALLSWSSNLPERQICLPNNIYNVRLVDKYQSVFWVWSA